MLASKPYAHAHYGKLVLVLRSKGPYLPVLYDIGTYHTSTIHLQAAEEKQNGFCRYTVTNKVTFWSARCSACVVNTKTIIHLSVGESGGYLPHRFGAQ